MEPVATGLETLVSVLTNVWSSMSGLVSTISSAPLLLIALAFTFAFGTVSLAKKLMGIRRRR